MADSSALPGGASSCVPRRRNIWLVGPAIPPWISVPPASLPQVIVTPSVTIYALTVRSLPPLAAGLHSDATTLYRGTLADRERAQGARRPGRR